MFNGNISFEFPWAQKSGWKMSICMKVVVWILVKRKTYQTYCSNLHESYILEQRIWSKSYFEVFNKSNSIFAKNHKFVPADLVSIGQKPDFRPSLTSKSGSKCTLSHYNERVDIGTMEICVRSVWDWAELKICVLRDYVVLGTTVRQNPDRIRLS